MIGLETFLVGTLLVAIVGVLVFGFVVFFGAPYLPTLRPQIKTALDMLDLRPGDTLVELGSGDGRVMVAAAERGLCVIGYELNPLLVLYSWLRTRKYKGRVRVVWGNFWRHTLPETDAVFVFLLQKYMKKLDKKITRDLSCAPCLDGAQGEGEKRTKPYREYGEGASELSTQRGAKSGDGLAGLASQRHAPGSAGVKLVSFAFTVPGRKPDAEKNGVYLYIYK